MGVGSAWGSREEMLHPRDRHGRFRKKWKMAQAVIDAIQNLLDKFQPRTFGSQNQANQYLHNLSQTSHGKLDVHRFLTDFHHTNAALRAGKVDPSTAKFVKMMDDSEVSLPNDLILSKVVNPDAFGLDAQTMHAENGGLEDWTGRLIADRGYSMANIGPEVPNKKPGQITMRIATPAGTKVNLPRKGPNDSGVTLKHDQELRITKVTPDGVGGYYVMAVATQRTPGETPIPHGGAEAPNIGHVQREANISKLRAVTEAGQKRRMGPSAEEAQAQHEADVAKADAERLAQGVQPNQPPTRRPASTPSPTGPTTTGPGGPPPRQEPIAHPGIGTKGGATPIPSGTAPENAPEHAPVQPISLDFRRAARDAHLTPPANGPRRAEWRRAYEGVANGKKNPEDVLRELEKDISVNSEKLDRLHASGNLESDPQLGRDIASQRDLADLIRREHGLGPAPAPEKPKRTRAPKEAPKLASVTPIKREERAKPAVPESAKPTKAPVTPKAPEAPAAPAKKATKRLPRFVQPAENRGMTLTQARHRTAMDAVQANPIEGDGNKLYKGLSDRLERGELTPSTARTAAKKIATGLREDASVARDGGDSQKADRLGAAADKFDNLAEKLQESGSVIHTDKYRRAEPGAPSAKPETVADLKKRAKESGVKGYSKMTKAQLQEALNAPKTEVPAPVKAAKKAAPETPKSDLDTTVAGLRDIAKREGVNLTGKTKKADIQQAIRDKREGKVPEAPTKAAGKAAAPAKKAVSKATDHDVAIENRIREVFRDKRRNGQWLGIADLKEAIGNDFSNEEVDAALKRMAVRDNSQNFRMIPVANTKALKPQDRRAAVHMGGEDNHMVTFMEDSSPLSAPSPAKAAKKAAAPVKKAAKAVPVKTPAAEKKIEAPDRAANFRNTFNEKFPGDEALNPSVREIRDDINRGTITPNEGITRLENDIKFNKDDLATAQRELRGMPNGPERDAKRKEIAKLRKDIRDQEKVSSWMHDYFNKDAPAITPDELKVELTPPQAKALEVASAEDIRRGAEKIGITGLEGNTKEEVFQDFVRKMAAQELAKRAAKKAAVKKLAPPKAPATPKPDLAESPYKRIDSNALAEGLDLRHPEDKKMLQVIQDQLDGKNTSLGKNPTPSQIGQNLEKWTGGPAGPSGRAALLEAMNAKPVQHLGETDEEFRLRKEADAKEVDALRARGNEWMRLAERLKNTRRTRKEHAPGTSTKEPKLTAPEKADLAKVAEATGIPEETLAKKAVAKKVAEAPPKPDAVSIVNTLKTVGSREEGHQLLQGRTKAELMEVAKASGVPTSSSMTKANLVDRLIEGNVGGRLEGEALRNLGGSKPLKGTSLRANLMNEDITSRGDLTEIEDRLGIKRGSLAREDRVNAIVEAMNSPEGQSVVKKLGVKEVPEQIAESKAKAPSPVERAARANEVGLRNQEIENELNKQRILAKKAAPGPRLAPPRQGVTDRMPVHRTAAESRAKDKAIHQKNVTELVDTVRRLHADGASAKAMEARIRGLTKVQADGRHDIDPNIQNDAQSLMDAAKQGDREGVLKAADALEKKFGRAPFEPTQSMRERALEDLKSQGINKPSGTVLEEHMRSLAEQDQRDLIRARSGGGAPTKAAKAATPKAAPALRLTDSQKTVRDAVAKGNGDWVKDTEIKLPVARASLVRKGILEEKVEGGHRMYRLKDSIATRGFRGDVQNPLSDKPLLENHWGNFGAGEVGYHPDSAIGRAIRGMDDRTKHLDVGGEPLANVMAKIATDGVRDKKTTLEMVQALKDLRKRIKDERAQRSVDEAIKGIEGEKMVNIPFFSRGTEVAEPLSDLLSAMANIPLARQRSNGPAPIERLSSIIQTTVGKESYSRFDILRQLRNLIGTKHESQEGYFEMRKVIQEALKKLEANMKVLKQPGE